MTPKEAIQELKDASDNEVRYGDTRHHYNEVMKRVGAFDIAIKALEQEPRKGHWILTDIEGYRVWHCNCSECGKDPQDYIGGSEDWWLIRNKLPKFCPNCGADMREDKE